MASWRCGAIALVTSVALLGSGCASRGGNGMLAGVGAVVATVGVSVYASDTPMEPSEGDSFAIDLDLTAPFGKALIGLGLAMMAGGVIGLIHDDDDDDDDAPDGVIASHSATGPMGAAAISEADRLGIRAAQAAQAGDCATVRLDVSVMHAMDAEYASALVEHDALIRACMDR